MLEAERFATDGPAFDALPVRRRRWPGRLRLRLALVRRGAALDCDLARGRRPDSDELHATRALQLLSNTYRRHIAEGLERAVRLSTRPPQLAGIAMQRVAIRDERDALLDLAARLLAPRPVSAQGVAIATLLLREPDSPLHVPARPGAIDELAGVALDALEPQ
jgi:hypothetical protein